MHCWRRWRGVGERESSPGRMGERIMANSITTALTTALSTTLADFGSILLVVVPVIFGISVGVFLLRRARGLIR